MSSYGVLAWTQDHSGHVCLPLSFSVIDLNENSQKTSVTMKQLYVSEIGQRKWWSFPPNAQSLGGSLDARQRETEHHIEDLTDMKIISSRQKS